ncbi:MAG: COX15/CtaA family protein [Candidatus Binataceae bacterium]
MSSVPASQTAAPPMLHRFAMLVVAATFVLLFAGGLVTSTGSALAIPDWPLAYGQLVPQFQHAGIVYEYTHRVVAGVVLLLTLALMIFAFKFEPRRWVRNLAVLAMGLVLMQALLGAVTVLLELPLAIAVSHAATAQAFFCLLVAIAVFTSARWATAQRDTESAASRSLAALAALTTAVIYAQVLVGALMRHMGAGLVIPDFPLSFGRIIPPYFDQFVAANFAHRCGALLVATMIIWLAARTLQSHRDDPWLRRPALALLALLGVQITLGALTVWTGKSVLPTTAHLVIGASLLATSLTLTLRQYRICAFSRASAAAAHAPAVTPQPRIMRHRATA